MKVFLCKSIFFLFTLITANLFFSGRVFAQRFAVTSGNWNGPIWATTAGGIAGSASIPTGATPVTINAGISVTMNVAGSCGGLAMFCGATSTSSITGINTLSLGGNITVTSAGTGIGGASILSPIALGTTDRTFLIDDDGTAANDLTISGVINASPNIGYTKTGLGTLLVSGNNVYSGFTTISGGILKIGGAGNATNTPLGVTARGTIIGYGATLDLNGFTLATAEPLRLSGPGLSNGGALTNTSAIPVAYSGLITLGSSSTILADAGIINITNTATISGTTFGLILGGTNGGTITSSIVTGSGTLTKTGNGIWTLSGVNTYSGATIISAGTLKIGGGNNISNSSAVTVDGTLDLAGANETIGSLAGSGRITSTIAAAIVLTVGNNNTSTTFSGLIENGAAASMGLAKAGSGTFTLSGSNSYTGITTVNGGRLRLGSAGDAVNTPLGTIAGITSVSAGATLDLNGFTLNTLESLILNGSGISNGGALSNSSSTSVSYNGLITLGGASRITANAGDINIQGTSVITGNTFRLTLAGTGNGIITRNINNTTGGLTKTGTGIWTVSGNSTYTAGTIVNGGTFKVSSAGDGTNTPLGTVAGRTTVIAGATLDLNGITLSTNEPLTINGAGAAGNGALINSAATNVNYNGTITLGNPSIIRTTGNITLGATGFTGAQDLTKVGAGTLNLATGISLLGSLLINEGAITSTTGNLIILRNFTNNSTFNNNNGVVNFNGTSAQTIRGSTSTIFNRLSINNGSGVSLNGVNATVNSILALTNGSLSIAANTLTLIGTVTGTGTLTGSLSSNLTIGGAGALGTLSFNQASNPLSNGVANLVISRTAGGTVTLGSTFNVFTSATFTTGVLNAGTNIFRLGGSVTRGTGTITTSGAGIVTFNGTAAQNIPAGIFTSNTARNITISNASGVTFNGNVAVAVNFQVNANSIFIPAPAVVISGAGTLLGNNSNNSVAQVTRATGTDDLGGQYTLTKNLTNLVIEYAGSAAQGIAAATTFGGLKISNSNAVNIAGNVTVGNGLNLNTGNLSIGSNTLTLNGAVSRTSGNLAGSHTSNLIIGGIAGSLFFDGTGTNNFLRDFTINTGASATLGNALNITGGASAGNEGTLTVSGTGVLTTGGFLTIKSNANGTARIAPGNTAGGYISGDVTVERFIPQNANKAWRLLASNTSGQTINAAWQEGQIGFLSNTNPGFGTMIAGQFSTVAQAQALGFDTLSQAPSLYRYDAPTDNLVGIPNTNSTLINSQQGYFIYIRGDRSPNQFGASIIATTSTTLRSKGAIFQGNQSGSSVPDGQYAFLRNPYASAIDLRNVTIGGNLVDAYQVWDPKLTGSFGLGAYQTLTRSGADYIVTPGGGSYPSSGLIVNTIESGAAFIVQATGGAGTIQVTENSKTSGSNLRFRPSGILAESSRLITNLYAINGTTPSLADGNLILLDAANNNGFDKYDVKKGTNFGENFGIIKNGIDLVVERRSLSSAGDTVFFSMSRLKRINYKLEINPSNINDPLLSAFLEDKYKATLTPVSLTDITSYNFTVDAAAASDRFRIVFRPQSPLPVTFTSIKAAQVNNNIVVEWKVANQLNIASYEVEKSTNGRSFNKVGSQIATQVSNASITYNWLDENAVTGVNYYRIKAIELSGNVKYTDIVKVVLGKAGTGITVSPNPVRGNLVNIQFNNQQAGRYNIRLMNNAGQEVYKNVLQHTGGNASQSINIPSAIARGIYQLEVIAPDNTKKVQKLIVDLDK